MKDYERAYNLFYAKMDEECQGAPVKYWESKGLSSAESKRNYFRIRNMKNRHKLPSVNDIQVFQLLFSNEEYEMILSQKENEQLSNWTEIVRNRIPGRYPKLKPKAGDKITLEDGEIVTVCKSANNFKNICIVEYHDGQVVKRGVLALDERKLAVKP